MKPKKTTAFNRTQKVCMVSQRRRYLSVMDHDRGIDHVEPPAREKRACGLAANLGSPAPGFLTGSDEEPPVNAWDE